MSESSVTLNSGSGGANVRTEQATVQGTVVQQEVVIPADDMGTMVMADAGNAPRRLLEDGLIALNALAGMYDQHLLTGMDGAYGTNNLVTARTGELY